MTNTLTTPLQADEVAGEETPTAPQVFVGPETHARPYTRDGILTPPPFLLARDVRREASPDAPGPRPVVEPEGRTARPSAESLPASATRGARPAELIEAEAEVEIEAGHGAGREAETAAFEIEEMKAPVVAPAGPRGPAAAPHAPKLDHYAVGMRVLRISPAWLLLSGVGFFLVIFLLSSLQQSATHPAARAEAETTSRPAREAAAPALSPAAGGADAAAKSPAADSLSDAAAPQGFTPAAQSAPPPASAGGRFAVQVGSHSNLSEANGHVSELRAAGLEARAAAVEIPRRGTWFRVYVGGFGTREEAARFGGQLRERGIAPAALVAEVE
jgi:hypothetical protein